MLSPEKITFVVEFELQVHISVLELCLELYRLTLRQRNIVISDL